jgi:hypothetical protein
MQKRRKARVTIIDGEEIDDLDEWLLANADDLTLHQMERWDLIMQREDEERAARDPEDPSSEPRKLALDLDEIETTFESLQGADPAYSEMPECAFLNLTSGKVTWPESEEEADEFWADENLLALPEEIEEHGQGYADMADFVASLDDGPVCRRLAKAIQGRGAFRRFKDLVATPGRGSRRDGGASVSSHGCGRTGSSRIGIAIPSPRPSVPTSGPSCSAPCSSSSLPCAKSPACGASR